LSYAQNALFKGANSFTCTVSDGQSSSTSKISFANAAAGIIFNVVVDGTDPDAANSSNLSIQSVGTTAQGGLATKVGNTIKFVPKANLDKIHLIIFLLTV
jgi:hypothetical protein